MKRHKQSPEGSEVAVTEERAAGRETLTSCRLERIEDAIDLIRGRRVMLDDDLAALYGVRTAGLKRAVNRNLDRFPGDFMLTLTREEADAIARSRRQNGALKRGQNIKHLPYAFTEQGVAMLSSVLRSRRATQVNIAIMRAFVRLRETFALHAELAHKLAELARQSKVFRARFDLTDWSALLAAPCSV